MILHVCVCVLPLVDSFSIFHRISSMDIERRSVCQGHPAMSDCGDLYPLPAWKSRIEMSGVASWYVMVSFLLPSDHDNKIYRLGNHMMIVYDCIVFPSHQYHFTFTYAQVNLRDYVMSFHIISYHRESYRIIAARNVM